MTLSPHQQEVFNKIVVFLEQNYKKVFVLKGYAGTGKTTMVRFIIEYLKKKNNINPVLLATTGRAAKVLQDKTGFQASTLHSQIYYLEGVEGKDDNGQDPWESSTGQLYLNFGVRPILLDDEKRQVFIVDEASMLTHVPQEGIHGSKYGSGSILDDFMGYTDRAQVIFVGDPCQLPPVSNDPYSSSLFADFLSKRYGCLAEEAELQEIHRQQEGSEILSMAFKVREEIYNPPVTKYPKIKVPQLKNSHVYFSEDLLLHSYMNMYAPDDPTRCIMISYTNKKCQELNIELRRRMGKPAYIAPGDLLMVTQNSYTTGLVNGDQVLVLNIGRQEQRAGFTLLNVRLKSLHNDKIYETLLINELLYNNNPNIQPEEAKRLLIDFDTRTRNNQIRRNSQEYKKLMNSDIYLNALRAKYGYCVTCHKAQGGEWPHVFLHIAGTLFLRQPAEVRRWYYTAITRAQRHLHINNGYWIEGFDRYKTNHISSENS